MTRTDQPQIQGPDPLAVKPRPPFSSHVLEENMVSRVERIEFDENRFVIRKTNRTRPFLSWRTFLMQSCASREFSNLKWLCEAGIPCVRPLDWGETRVLGCAPRCYLVTEFVDARNLQAVIAALPQSRSSNTAMRRVLVTKFGELTAAVHRLGVLSTTLQPRNVLVGGDPRNPHLLLCDQPAMIAWPHSVHATRRAEIDLYDVAFSLGRRREFSHTERYRLLLGYTDGDRAAVRRIWRKLFRRPRWVHRMLKSLPLAVCRHSWSPWGRRGSKIRRPVQSPI
jgi:Lipopolysaccharide kinase (Kdo/WaaP) family